MFVAQRVTLNTVTKFLSQGQGSCPVPSTCRTQILRSLSRPCHLTPPTCLQTALDGLLRLMGLCWGWIFGLRHTHTWLIFGLRVLCAASSLSHPGGGLVFCSSSSIGPILQVTGSDFACSSPSRMLLLLMLTEFFQSFLWLGHT